ncbi:hypothetical protein [Lentilactobacillus sp. SPB1-3]|uniref:Uncharacterized protein n=1 Tax=Lentilactobacillus terminaliae TaxID=3003483 RepID=A0ACD5DCX8_9LACO|nr:hypothetical protein [Lentilactobacillus sp. SPB1-3]MCZ0978067.1 hypothetical protein [Lentilactobacillus sp. SPB1-3]
MNSLAKYRKNHIITIGGQEYRLVEDPSFMEGKREVVILEVTEKEDK